MTTKQGILGLVAIAAVAAVTVATGNFPFWKKTTRVLVVRTGDPAPGIPPGARFRDFKDVCLNSSGQVAFWGAIEGPGVTTDDDEGIWMGYRGSLALVARKGADAPGVSGHHLRTLGDGLVLNDAGQVAFWARMMDQPAYEGVWVGGVGALALVAQTGQSAPGSDGGVTFETFDQVRLNAAGQVAFHARLDGPNLTEADNDGIWIGTPGNVALAVRQPGPDPGHPIVESDKAAFSDLSLNAAGTLMFRGQLQPVVHDVGGGVEIQYRFEIFVSHSPYGASEVIVHPIAVAYRSTTFGYLHGPSLGATNNFTFSGEIVEENWTPCHYTGLWFYNVSSSLIIPWSPIASEGTQNNHPPGTPAGTLYGNLAGVTASINDKDEIAFAGPIKGAAVTNADNVGIWADRLHRRPAGSSSLVARKGSNAVGASGALFGEFGAPFITAAGNVVFGAQLTGSGVNDNNAWGIWIANPQGSLKLVARDGDKVPTGNNIGPIGSFSTVKDYGLPAYSNSGQFACKVSFTDGTQGVVVVTPVVVTPAVVTP